MGNCQSHDTDNQQQVSLERTRSKFNPFYQINNQNADQQQILTQYHFHSNYDDKFLGRCSILENKQNKDFYLSKQIEINDEQIYQKKLNEYLLIQSKINSENVIQIKHIIQKETDGFFSQRRKIILIVDYPLTNLQKQFNSRFINKLEFNREQVINILISCIKGYALIERERSNTNCEIFKNDKIRLKNLFFGIKNRDSLIKVAQSSLLNEQTNLTYVINGDYDSIENRDIYISPEEFYFFIKGKKEKQFDKAGVFSFGMSILDICLMNSSREIYHFNEKKMDFNEMRNRILIAGKKYGPILEKFLNDMLMIDDRKRLTFNELQAKIPSLLVSRNATQGSKINLSIARSNSYYLKNDPKAVRSSSKDSKDGSYLSKRSKSRKGSMNRSVASSVSFTSRNSANKFSRRLKQRQDLEELDKVHEIYDKFTGREYIGQKKGLVKHGQGRYQFSKDSGYYEGEWRNDKMQGKGESYFRQGQLQYSGEWKSDEYHGWGILYSNPQANSNWISYQGEFKNGVKEGRGQIQFKNGMTYDGEFRGDKIHGRGKIIMERKVIRDQFWQMSNFESFLRQNKLQI